MEIRVLMWLIATILFAVSAFFNPPRVSLLSVGCAFLTLGFLIPALD